MPRGQPTSPPGVASGNSAPAEDALAPALEKAKIPKSLSSEYGEAIAKHGATIWGRKRSRNPALGAQVPKLGPVGMIRRSKGYERLLFYSFSAEGAARNRVVHELISAGAEFCPSRRMALMRGKHAFPRDPLPAIVARARLDRVESPDFEHGRRGSGTLQYRLPSRRHSPSLRNSSVSSAISMSVSPE